MIITARTTTNSRYAILILLLTLCEMVYAAKPIDVRIVIDLQTSQNASFKQDVLNAFIQQLPNKSRAGVWTYGKYVNMLVPYKTVTDSWRVEAKNALSKLKAQARLRNTLDAVDIATADWAFSHDSQMRPVVFLYTEGKIKVLPDAADNRLEEKIFEEKLIPRLKRWNVDVVVATPEAGKDYELLQRLAAISASGSPHVVNNAQDIHLAVSRALNTKVYTKSTESKISNKIPATQKSIPVITEPHNSVTKIAMTPTVPLQQSNSPSPVVPVVNQTKAMPASVSATVTKPVISSIDQLPSSIYRGEGLNLQVDLPPSMQGQNEVLINLAHYNNGQIIKQTMLKEADDKRHVQYAYQAPLPLGKHRIVMNMSHDLKHARVERTFEVLDNPVKLEITKPTLKTPAFHLQVTANASQIKPDSVSLQGTVYDSATGDSHAAIYEKKGHQWTMTLPYNQAMGDYVVSHQVDAKTVSGRNIHFALVDHWLSHQPIEGMTHPAGKNLTVQQTEEIQRERPERSSELPSAQTLANELVGDLKNTPQSETKFVPEVPVPQQSLQQSLVSQNQQQAISSPTAEQQGVPPQQQVAAVDKQQPVPSQQQVAAVGQQQSVPSQQQVAAVGQQQSVPSPQQVAAVEQQQLIASQQPVAPVGQPQSISSSQSIAPPVEQQPLQLQPEVAPQIIPETPKPNVNVQSAETESVLKKSASATTEQVPAENVSQTNELEKLSLWERFKRFLGTMASDEKKTPNTNLQERATKSVEAAKPADDSAGKSSLLGLLSPKLDIGLLLGWFILGTAFILINGVGIWSARHFYKKWRNDHENELADIQKGLLA